MLLRNKKTGEVGELHFEPDKEYHFTVATEDPADIRIYKELSLLSKEWEDYEEPKEYWWIDTGALPMVRKSDNPTPSWGEDIDRIIGNCFETKEEAEKAVEKLKALANLRKSGFKFTRWDADEATTPIKFNFTIKAEADSAAIDDLDLLFRGEE